MVGWRHQINGYELSKLFDGKGQGALACCSPLGHKELDLTEQLSKNLSRHRSFFGSGGGCMRAKQVSTKPLLLQQIRGSPWLERGCPGGVNSCP